MGLGIPEKNRMNRSTPEKGTDHNRNYYATVVAAASAKAEEEGFRYLRTRPTTHEPREKARTKLVKKRTLSTVVRAATTTLLPAMLAAACSLASTRLSTSSSRKLLSASPSWQWPLSLPFFPPALPLPLSPPSLCPRRPPRPPFPPFRVLFPFTGIHGGRLWSSRISGAIGKGTLVGSSLLLLSDRRFPWPPPWRGTLV